MWKVCFGGCDPQSSTFVYSSIWSMSGPRSSHSNWVLMLSENVFAYKRTLEYVT